MNLKLSPSQNLDLSLVHLSKDPTELSRDEAFLQKVIQQIETSFHEEEFNVKSLASHMCLSVSQLNRKLNTLLKCPPGYLIRNIRLKEAARLLSMEKDSIGEIAFRVGFKSQANFCRSFRQYYGCAPTSFIKEINRKRENDKSLRKNEKQDLFAQLNFEYIN